MENWKIGKIKSTPVTNPAGVINVPDLKIIVGKSEIIFEGRKEIMLSEIADVYLRLETYLKRNGYLI